MNKDILYSKLIVTSTTTGVPILAILNLLHITLKGKLVEFNKVVTATGISKNSLSQVLKELNFLFLDSKSGLRISTNNRSVVENLLKTMVWSEEGVLNLSKINKVDLGFFNRRLRPERNYDQFLATPETVGNRAILMYKLGDLKMKNIALIGDDDFTSVAIAKQNSANLVNVLEVDGRIAGEISTIAKEDSLNIKVLKSDVRNTLPKNVLGKFDVVFTDPPYTANGVELFLSRAVELLNMRNKTGRIYFCYGSSDSAKERFIPVYETVARLGLMIRYVFDKFNRYTGAVSIGNASTLFIAEVTSKTRNTINGNYDKPIYTGTTN